ncbi:MAG: sel1 repeat family protein [Kiritimatiellae bacterium]|nr:sel1 repeat family protein [Kiritimatiellia bacterium]
MQQKLSDALPGFKMFNAFFAGLKGDFKPMPLTDNEKAAFKKRLADLNGKPKELFMTLHEDLELTAQVREARRYADGRTFVRYEFRRLGYRCAWSRPYQLMVVFDRIGNLDSYTVLRGRGEVSDGLAFSISPRWYNWDTSENTNDPAVAIGRLKKDDECEVAIQNKATKEWFAYIYGRNGSYTVEWYICCDPWLMTISDLTFPQIESLIKVTGSLGVKGLEDAFEWEQFNFDGLHRSRGVLVCVDCDLYRSLEFAVIRKDEMRVKTALALGAGAEPAEKPYTMWIASGSLAAQRHTIFDMATAEHDKTKAAKLFAMLALRGHTPSRCSLGRHFHLGKGVPKDYDLAIYWYTLAAKAGDTHAMTNLGKIFSEKNNPRRDKSKAIKWLEKAAAKKASGRESK